MPDIEIKNWTARRSGGRITIRGVNARTEEPITVSGIDTISKIAPRKNPIATKNDVEQRWVLL